MIISSADIYKKDVSTERVFFYVFFYEAYFTRQKRRQEQDLLTASPTVSEKI